MKIIIPALSPTGQHLMFAPAAGMMNRYGWLGHSFEEIVLTILFNPLETFRKVFIVMGGWDYLVLLMLPLLFLPIVGSNFYCPAWQICCQSAV